MKSIFINCTGNSMHPTLKSGQLLLVDTASIPVLGDIIVFATPKGEQYVHRLIAKKDGELITRGDNNKFYDDFTITAADVLGVVIGIKRATSLKKVANGNLGLIIGSYRNIVRKYRFIYVQPFIWFMHLTLIKSCLASLGELIFKKRITIIRTDGMLKLYFKKSILGTYDISNREFRIRPVMQPFFSDYLYKELQKRVERTSI